MMISKRNIAYLMEITGKPIGYTCRENGRITYYETLDEARTAAATGKPGVLISYGLTNGKNATLFGSVTA